MILNHDVSALFFSDPTLHLSPGIQLSWFTGWDGVDVHSEIARETQRIAKKIGARRVIFSGSSGGGFAALQVSSFVPDSVALAFNAQTEIAKYRVNGESWGVQREYVRTVWPKVWNALDSAGVVENGKWAGFVDDRISAVQRYSKRQPNRIYLVQNLEEFHYVDHHLPMLEAATLAKNEVTEFTNREGKVHNPPRAETFNSVLSEVINRESLRNGD